MTNEDRRRISARLAVKPHNAADLCQFYNWYKEDIPVLMEVVREKTQNKGGKMKIIILGAFLLGLAFAFLGVYVCCYGGIVTFVRALQSSPISAGGIAWGIVRFFLGIPCGWATMFLWLFGIHTFVKAK